MTSPAVVQPMHRAIRSLTVAEQAVQRLHSFSPAAWKLYTYLCLTRNPAGCVEASLNELARGTGLARRTVVYELRKLRQQDLIDWTRPPGTAVNTYRILFAPRPPAPPPPPDVAALLAQVYRPLTAAEMADLEAMIGKEVLPGALEALREDGGVDAGMPFGFFLGCLRRSPGLGK